MRKIKVFLGICACLLLCGMMHMPVKAEEKTIGTDGDWISDSVDSDVNFYMFSIPSAGRVSYSFQSYSTGGRCSLYYADLTERFAYVECSGTQTSPGTQNKEVDLEAGDYCLKVSNYYNSEEAWDGSYRIRVSFDPANNNETEPNNSFDTAMQLNDNELVKGLISENDEMDFYKIALDTPRTVEVVWNNSSYCKYSLWNSDLIAEHREDSYIPETHVWEYQLDAGIYYIKIQKYSSYTGTYTLKYNTKQYVTSINLKKSQLTLDKGRTYSLLAGISPSDATNQNLSWSSSDKNVAAVDASGRVTAKAAGAATITASAKDGGKASKSCTVIVKPAKAVISKLTGRSSYYSGNTVEVSMKSQDGVDGYEIAYAANAKFSNSSKVTTYYTSRDVSSLTKGKRYYFKVRAYIEYNGKFYHGAWSKVKSIKI